MPGEVVARIEKSLSGEREARMKAQEEKTKNCGKCSDGWVLIGKNTVRRCECRGGERVVAVSEPIHQEAKADLSLAEILDRVKKGMVTERQTAEQQEQRRELLKRQAAEKQGK